MQDCIINNHQSQFSEGNKYLAAWVQQGTLKYKVKIVKDAKLSGALLSLFEVNNIGKMILEV